MAVKMTPVVFGSNVHICCLEVYCSVCGRGHVFIYIYIFDLNFPSLGMADEIPGFGGQCPRFWKSPKFKLSTEKDKKKT